MSPLSYVTAGSELGFSEPSFFISKMGKVCLPVGIEVWVNKMPREYLAEGWKLKAHSGSVD